MAISFVVAITLSMIPFIAIVSIIVFLIHAKYNIISGILLFTIIAFVGFMIYPQLFVIWYGDIYYTIGGISALILTFKNLKPDQLPIKTGLKVGIIGAGISSFLISIYQWFFYTILNSFDIIILGINFAYFTPFALILGSIIGYIYGYIKKKQEEDGEQELSLIDM
ncbi:hypothetical protein LCGC14_0602180 [marine sediment metagenome]|uniref:Uncharacterized protein n=1 Tax=marine sediment metagenome TaxID=412755 RepID=A0A0F9RAC7_9ZZZZ